MGSKEETLSAKACAEANDNSCCDSLRSSLPSLGKNYGPIFSETICRAMKDINLAANFACEAQIHSSARADRLLNILEVAEQKIPISIRRKHTRLRTSQGCCLHRGQRDTRLAEVRREVRTVNFYSCFGSSRKWISL